MFDPRDREIISQIQTQWLEPPTEVEMAPCWCGHEWEDHREKDEQTPCTMRSCTCANYEVQDLSAFYEDLSYRNQCCPDK